MPMNYCPNCGREYAPHSAMCPPCNHWFRTPEPSLASAHSGFDKKMLVSFAGAVLLLVGLFMPLVGVPFFTFNYYNLTQFSSLAGLGFFLLLLSGISAIVLTATRRCGLLKWPGLAALIISAYTFFVINSKLSEAKTEMTRNMASMPEAKFSPIKGMGDAFMSMIQMQWGWGVLVAGAALLIVASMLKDE